MISMMLQTQWPDPCGSTATCQQLGAASSLGQEEQAPRQVGELGPHPTHRARLQVCPPRGLWSP